jgi:hypothetical protein
MVRQHPLNSFFHELPIFRVYEIQIFFDSWWFAIRVETVNPEQLRRPVTESGSVECPVAHMGKALPLNEIKLASLQSFPGTLAIFNIREGSVPSDNVSMLVPKWNTTHEKPSISPVSGATEAHFFFEKLTGRMEIRQFSEWRTRSPGWIAHCQPAPELCSTESPVYSVHRLFTNVLEPLDKAVKVIAGIVSTTSRRCFS